MSSAGRGHEAQQREQGVVIAEGGPQPVVEPRVEVDEPGHGQGVEPDGGLGQGIGAHRILDAVRDLARQVRTEAQPAHVGGQDGGHGERGGPEHQGQHARPQQLEDEPRRP